MTRGGHSHDSLDAPLLTSFIGGLGGRDISDVEFFAMAGEALGAIGTDPTTYMGPVGAAASLGRQMATGAASQAAQGAIVGFNSGEGGLENRLSGATTGGLMGAGIGAAAPAALTGLAKGAQWTGDQLLSRFFPKMQPTIALRKAAEALAQHGGGQLLGAGLAHAPADANNFRFVFFKH
jgi:hypothetical protein